MRARFRDEVKARVEQGIAACPSERMRLMWVGAGLWHDTDFYTAFEEAFGAVFVWSMYLAFGPDGYIRYGLDDPLQALASRTVSMNEQLHNPPWANEWIVDQAQRHRIDAALVLRPWTRALRHGQPLHRARSGAGGHPGPPDVRGHGGRAELGPGRHARQGGTFLESVRSRHASRTEQPVSGAQQ